MEPPRAAAIALGGVQPDLVLFLVPGLRADFPGEPGAEIDPAWNPEHLQQIHLTAAQGYC